MAEPNGLVPSPLEAATKTILDGWLHLRDTDGVIEAKTLAHAALVAAIDALPDPVEALMDSPLGPAVTRSDLRRVFGVDRSARV